MYTSKATGYSRSQHCTKPLQGKVKHKWETAWRGSFAGLPGVLCPELPRRTAMRSQASMCWIPWFRIPCSASLSTHKMQLEEWKEPLCLSCAPAMSSSGHISCSHICDVVREAVRPGWAVKSGLECSDSCDSPPDSELPYLFHLSLFILFYLC